MRKKSRTETFARLGGGALVLLSIGVVAPWQAGSAPAFGRPAPVASLAEQPESGPAEVVVFFRSRTPVQGELVRRDATEIVLRIAGIETTLSMSDVLRVDIVPPVEEHYRKLRAVIRDDDVQQLLVLIDWLRDRGAYHLALEELAGILKRDPGNAEAQQLRNLVEGQVRLRQESMRLNGPEDEDEEPGGERARRPEFPVLTRDQLNLLKVYEVELGDPPKMSVDRETVRELMDTYAGNELIPQSREGRAALERRPAERILELMFRLKARDFYNRVEVEGEPRAFRLFRENVHRDWLINSCASNACHGGQQAGRLWLNNENQNAERTIYTNFLILDRYRLADGTPLINYEAPADSPLLQMSLPREESLYPHPLVATSRSAAWRPVIGSVDDRRFLGTVEWINAMYRPRPEYPVTYSPPVPSGGVPEMPRTPIGER